MSRVLVTHEVSKTSALVVLVRQRCRHVLRLVIRSGNLSLFLPVGNHLFSPERFVDLAQLESFSLVLIRILKELLGLLHHLLILLLGQFHFNLINVLNLLVLIGRDI
jgi:hypothetical protein